MPTTFRLFMIPVILLSACSAIAPIPTFTPSATATSRLTSTTEPSPTTSPSQTASPTLLPISGICTPLQDHELSRITQYISNPYKQSLTSNLENPHHGVDFSYYTKDGSGPPIDGNPVQSMLAGRVAAIGINRLPYGNMLVIETPFEILPLWITDLYAMRPGSSLYLLYGHMLEFPIQQIGDRVTCGQTIGLVGNSGFSGNPHLHLETRVGPAGLDLPTMIFYETTATLAEQAAYNEWRTGDTWAKFDPTPFLIQAGAQ